MAEQTATLVAAGFDVDPVRRWLWCIYDMLSARMQVTTRSELERLLITAEEILDGNLDRLQVDFPGGLRLALHDGETIQLDAGDGALLRRVVDTVMAELEPFAATLGVTLERAGTASGECACGRR